LSNGQARQHIMLQEDLPAYNVLERILGLTWKHNKSVETQMKGISLSLLHTSLLSWLAFDIIRDKDAFNRQPCVASMKLALEVQRDLADNSMLKFSHTS
jgi:hypothetical protein